jgi:hypothetical protein
MVEAAHMADRLRKQAVETKPLHNKTRAALDSLPST